MTILVDSNVLIDHLRGSPAAIAAIESVGIGGERLAASVLSKVEILAGMQPTEEHATRRLLQGVDWIEVDDQVAEAAGSLASQYLRSHRHIELADYVVAATAQRLGATLWTLNRKHFPMFPTLPDPYGS